MIRVKADLVIKALSGFRKSSHRCIVDPYSDGVTYWYLAHRKFT